MFHPRYTSFAFKYITKDWHDNRSDVIVLITCYSADMLAYDKIEHYLAEVLGGSFSVEPWGPEKGLPFYLRDTYDFGCLRLFGTPCVLVIAKPDVASEGILRRHLEVVANHAPNHELPIYVAPAMASYERRRLIERRVPFIVPGKQMFLPPLGVDLRQFFRSRRAMAGQNLSPATQALLFTALLRDYWQFQIAPDELNLQLQYTDMTISRAVREIETAGLAKTVQNGREKWLHFELQREEVWRRAQQHLRSPVARTRWAAANDLPLLRDAPTAGLQSLANRSDLASPAHPVKAIDAARWKQAKRDGLIELPVQESDATQWQVWRYDPRALADRGQVDLLSLIVSLHDDQDERVQASVRQLENQLPW